jgi:hypothetical protein
MLMLGAIRVMMRLDAVLLMHMRRAVIAKAVHGTGSIRESKRGVRGEHAECVSHGEKDRRSDAKRSGQASQHRFEDKSVPQHCNICLAPVELRRTAGSGREEAFRTDRTAEGPGRHVWTWSCGASPAQDSTSARVVGSRHGFLIVSHADV